MEDVTLSAADVKGEPRYNQTIDLTGLSTDRYYPVWWQFPSNGGANSWLTINRWYAEDREKDLFSKGEFHIAGLLLQIEGGDFIWGGDAKYLNIKRIRQTYRKTVKNVRHGMMSIARPIDGKYPLYENVKPGDIVYCKRFSGCYLRGGLTYHVTSNFSDVNYSRKDDEVEISSALEPQSNFEIKWMVKSYAIDDPILGKDYDDIVLPYAHDYAETINLAQNALPKSGGRVSGNITITTDSVIMFHRNSDWASLGFKNTDDSDTDSFMYFETGDNSNEYFKWRHQPYGKTAEDWMTLKRDNLRIKGHQVYHEGNTTVVDGGYLKKASPIINIWGNGEFATNAESTGSIVERLSEGVYLIKGVLGFNADTAWGGSDGGIEIPLCKNKLPLIWIDYQVQSNGLIKLMVYHREHTKVPEFAQNVHPDYSDGDLIDIPIGRFISIRVQMPEDSIWNKKLREFSEML
ncbi:hypothetical protein XNA1_3890001 [Xenorhabdus nematophila str. Anatoliense]|nr:hypothetical protein XNA1_3890001 [Xenorhabdus nematophila str. Anatoliense]